MINWTQLNNPEDFTHGEQSRVHREHAVFTLHKYQGKGWILKIYRGKYFASPVYPWPAARRRWNSEVV